MAGSGKNPRDVAKALGARARAPRREPSSTWRRETFRLPRQDARDKAREWFERFPKAAYMTEVESWREMPDGEIEFTMRRLPTAD
jgi:hypothetical protein